MFLAADGEAKQNGSLSGCGVAAAPLKIHFRLTFVCVGEGTSEGAAHSDITVLKVFQYQMLHWDGLSVHLEAVALVPGDVAGQNQQLSEQEHVQLLRGRSGTDE